MAKDSSHRASTAEISRDWLREAGAHRLSPTSAVGVLALPERFVSARTPPLRDEVAAKVFLGSERVVRGAAQRQIRGHVRAQLREWLQVMQLEVARLGAAQPT